MIPDFLKSSISARIFYQNYGTNLDDCRNFGVLLHADSDDTKQNFLLPWGTMPIYKIKDHFVDFTAQLMVKKA